MGSLNAFVVAVDLAERQRDAARQTLANMQSARQAAQAQLEQLSGYAAETEQRWGMKEGAAVQPEVMHHHYQFMGRLDHAIGLQTQAVSGQDRRLQQAQQTLLQAGLRKVLEHRRAELAREQQRREQKQTDERASQRAAARTNPADQE